MSDYDPLTPLPPELDSLRRALGDCRPAGGCAVGQVRFSERLATETARPVDRATHPMWHANAGDTLAAMLTDPVVRSCVTGCTFDADLVRAAGWQQFSAFELAGELAMRVAQGGAYQRFAQPPAQAMAIAEAARRAMIGDSYDGGTMWLLKTHRRVNDWVVEQEHPGWTGTYVTYLLPQRRLTIVTYGDMD